MAGTIVVDRIESDASYASTINVAGQITFSNTVNFGTTSSPNIKIDNLGNVGIGTTSPSTYGKLAVVSSTAGSAVVSIQDTSGGASPAPLLQFGVNSSNGFNTADAARVWTTATSGSTSALNFAAYNGGTPSTAQMLLSGGNVGIGTSTLTNKLNVAGGIQSSSQLTAVGANTVAISQESGYGRLAAFGPNSSTAGTLYLYVIDSNGGNQRGAIIDSLGRVSMAAQPYLHATVANGTTAINFGTTHANVTVPYNSIFTNTGNHFNTSTSTFTCPVAGIYLVYATIQLGQAAGTTGVGPNMQVNRSGGSITGSYHFVQSSVGYQKMETTAYVKCAANDTLSITLYTGSAMTGGQTEFNGDSRNALCIAYIG